MELINKRQKMNCSIYFHLVFSFRQHYIFFINCSKSAKEKHQKNVLDQFNFQLIVSPFPNSPGLRETHRDKLKFQSTYVCGYDLPKWNGTCRKPADIIYCLSYTWPYVRCWVTTWYVFGRLLGLDLKFNPAYMAGKSATTQRRRGDVGEARWDR